MTNLEENIYQRITARLASRIDNRFSTRSHIIYARMNRRIHLRIVRLRAQHS